MADIPPGLTRKQRKRLAAAKRAAESKAKNEQLKGEREQQQGNAGQHSIALVQVSESAKKSEPPIAQSTTGEHGRNETDNRPQATRAENTIAFCSAALVVLAFAQGATMIRQNWIMQDQMAQTDETLNLMKRDQGAWLIVGTPTFNLFPEQDGKLELTAKLRNLGRSHAFVRYADINVEAGHPAAEITEEVVLGKIESDAMAFPHGERPLAPGDEMDVSLTIVGEAMPEIVEAMKDRTSWVYVTGRVAYDDPLGETIWQPFCFVYANDIKAALPYRLKKSQPKQE